MNIKLKYSQLPIVRLNTIYDLETKYFKSSIFFYVQNIIKIQIYLFQYKLLNTFLEFFVVVVETLRLPARL